jgi:hypothetical protein
VRQPVDALLAAKGIRDATAKQHRDLQAGLRASFESHAGKSVERVGEGMPKRWRIVVAHERFLVGVPTPSASRRACGSRVSFSQTRDGFTPMGPDVPSAWRSSLKISRSDRDI